MTTYSCLSQINLFGLSDGVIESSNLNQLDLIVLDVDTSDSNDEDTHTKQVPYLAYSTKAVDFTLLSLERSHHSVFLKGHPVRGPPKPNLLV